MVAILEKSDAAGRFEQIIDFLSGSYIHHALTVNPYVYISSIKQFWNTAVVKRSGDVTRLQALVDKKRIVITEEVVREILQLNDAEGVIYLPNDEIFAGLARMGVKGLENANAAQQLEIIKLKARVKKLERLNKSDAAGRFEQIIDFLSGSYIHHALTVNPYVYISSIKQFWNTAVVKRSGDVTRLQALVDKKRIVITEEVVREILQLNDAEGVIYLPNDEIFAGLARMGSKFYMYPRFIQLIIQSNIADLSKYTNRYISPVLTQKVFANIRRVKKGFSGVETPLFETMLALRDIVEEAEAQIPAQDDDVQEHAAEEVHTDVVPPISTSPSPSSPKLERLNKVKSSKLRRLKKVGTSQRVESSDDVENVFNQRRISVDMEMDEGIELVVDQEKDAEIEGRHRDK
nr:xylulose kinase-1 [Tanacetum cinerariifolium]